MRGTWDDLNRRLTSAIIALDLDDSLIVGDRVEVKRGFFGTKKVDDRPRRFVQVTATRDSVIGEVVGSTSFGGTWKMTPETEALLERQGWERPWSREYRTWQRQYSLMSANRMALACVRALQALGCEMADLEVEHVREESTE